MITWFKQKFCRHEFRYDDMVQTGIPKPPEPDKNAGYSIWFEYLNGLEKSDWHLKRVRWPCCKCDRVFEAHCGLDILKFGRVTTEKYHVYSATHAGWLLFCPLWLADLNEAPVPIPRSVPDWWFDFNFWLNDQLQWLVSLVDEESVGFLFYGIRELPQPKTIKVKAA